MSLEGLKGIDMAPKSNLSDEFVFYFWLGWFPFVFGLMLVLAPVFLVVPAGQQVVILPLGAALLLIAAVCVILYKYRSRTRQSNNPPIAIGAGPMPLPSSPQLPAVKTSPEEIGNLPYNGERSRPSLLAKRETTVIPLPDVAAVTHSNGRSSGTVTCTIEENYSRRRSYSFGKGD